MSLAVFHTWAMLVTSPQIGRLLCRPRKWAWRQVKAGAFGIPVRRRGRAFWVELARVESYTGGRFSRAQLIVAGLHPPPPEEPTP